MVETGARIEHLTSPDGTSIGFHVEGSGPPLVLVHGTAAAHWSFRFLAPLLRERFTVFAVDRRGRGESGDSTVYAIEREFDDVAAVVDSIDDPASLFGHSYGATVALGAALRTSNLDRLVLYGPAPGVQVVAADELRHVEQLVARGERDEGLARAFRSFGLTPDELAQLRGSPTWQARLDFAHTVAREVRAEEECRFAPEQLRGLRRPVLLLLGEESPAWAAAGTDRISSALHDGRVAVLPGQGHLAITTAPELVAREVASFLLGSP